MARAIVLIHGLWMSPLSWENWIAYYEKAGHQVLAPAWPGLEGTVDDLRRDTSGFDRLTLSAIVDQHAALVRELPEPPIIMGHSFGGAVTQILLDRGLGAAGVAIHPAPVRGVFRLPLSTLRSSWPVLRNPANRHRAVMLTPAQFHFAFTNTLSTEDAAAAYERYPVPGPGHVLFEGAAANLNPRSALRVNFRNNDRAPLLIIGGGLDHIVPVSVNRENFRRYRRSSAITAFRSVSDRSHYTVGQDGWEDVADLALSWALDPS